MASSLAEADLLVLNTCAVTAAAASDSRQKLRRAHRAGVGEIVVTGCWSQLAAEKAAAMPGVTCVVPNRMKDSLVSDWLQIPEFELEPLRRLPIPGDRHKTRAFIKVQDGCNNRCTFCVTTIARGPGRSRPSPAVLHDVQAALEGGANEIVLTGVHLGSWGQDFPEPLHLRHLVTDVLKVEELPRLRLSSLEPWDLDDDFFRLWKDPRLCRHLHLPLQSGSAATLRRMARNTTPSKFASLVESARSQIDDLALTTDIIVGFPGETETDFRESLDFVKAMEFTDAHVFTYSERGGTAAAAMPNPVHHATRKDRNRLIRRAVEESGRRFRRRFVGWETEVLWESAKPAGDDLWQMVGLSDNYLRVEATAGRPRWNQFEKVSLAGLTPKGLWASLVQGEPALWFVDA